jgi:hypothetical protein
MLCLDEFIHSSLFEKEINPIENQAMRRSIFVVECSFGVNAVVACREPCRQCSVRQSETSDMHVDPSPSIEVLLSSVIFSWKTSSSVDRRQMSTFHLRESSDAFLFCRLPRKHRSLAPLSKFDLSRLLPLFCRPGDAAALECEFDELPACQLS